MIEPSKEQARPARIEWEVTKMNERKWYRLFEYAGVGLVLFLCVSAESIANFICR